MWRAKYRLPDGRQVHRKVGPAWTRRGRPPAGYFTKTTAERWLRDVLDQARRGTLPGLVRTGLTLREASGEWLAYLERDRQVKCSTLRDYRSTLDVHWLPALGDTALEEITAATVRRRFAAFGDDGRALSNRTRQKSRNVLHALFAWAVRTHGGPGNPVTAVESPTVRLRTELDIFSREDVCALVWAAASEQDGAVYVTAAFTGLRRGELVALRWRDVDFPVRRIRVTASYVNGVHSSPKSGKVRSLPMAHEVAEALARLGQRAEHTGEDDLVFPGVAGLYLDASALRRRYTAALARAGLRPLRFHDLRHTFGTLAVSGGATLTQVQAWMGHADIDTTMIYQHYSPRADEADLLDRALGSPTELAPSGRESRSSSRATPSRTLGRS